MRLLRKIAILLISLGFLIYVIFKVEPPKDWVSASIFQILIFFIPLLLTVTFFADLFINYLPRSFIIGLSFLILSVLQALKLLNILSGVIVILGTIVLFRFFPKTRLTFFTKIPKLTKIRRD